MQTEETPILELGGKEYKTVRINNLIWMAENLTLLTRESWFYDENALNGNAYGRLYTWQAAMDSCPEGWRLPSVEDWDEMIRFFGDEEKTFRELVKTGDETFNARFGGYRSLKGDFLSLERAADFWTSTEAGQANAWLFYLLHKKEKVFRIIDDKHCGFSVRYVCDI